MFAPGAVGKGEGSMARSSRAGSYSHAILCSGRGGRGGAISGGLPESRRSRLRTSGGTAAAVSCALPQERAMGGPEGGRRMLIEIFEHWLEQHGGQARP